MVSESAYQPLKVFDRIAVAKAFSFEVMKGAVGALKLGENEALRTIAQGPPEARREQARNATGWHGVRGV